MLTSTTLGIVILLLGQILFWASIVYTSLLVLRYRKITEWYNRKAGKEIVSHFRFRSLAPLVLTAFFGLIALCVGLTSATGDNVSNEQVSYNMLWAGILALVYPVSWLVWRLVRAGRSENPRAERWRLIHDASLNIAIGFGGGIVLIIGVGLTVLASFTKWDHFFPEKWREIAGVDVVPESKTHYLVAAGLSVVAIITQFIPNGENIVTTIIGLVALAVVGIVVWKIWHTPKELRHSIAWRWGYIAVSSYIVFIVTFWIILVIVTLYAIYLILTYVVGGGAQGKSSGSGNYRVTCNHLSHDLLGGSNKCDISGDTCSAINGGSCPYK